MDNKFKIGNKLHKKQIDERTKTWGKGNNKFKPQPYVSQTAVGATPWHHVKNDIIDDADEANHQKRMDMESSKAKEFLQKREQNYRRNIIEAKRKESTAWESFDDETKKKGKYIPTAILNAQQNEVKDLTAEDRNFFRRKLTKAALSRNLSLKSAMVDLTRNGVLRGGINKKKQ